MPWEVDGRKRVKIEGVEVEVSSAEELIEKIKQRARELGFRTFVVYDQDDNELEPADIREQFDSITEVRLGKYDTPAASSSVFYGVRSEITNFLRCYPEANEMDAVFFVHDEIEPCVLREVEEKYGDKKRIWVFACPFENDFPEATPSELPPAMVLEEVELRGAERDFRLDVYDEYFKSPNVCRVFDSKGILVALIVNDTDMFLADVHHGGRRFDQVLELMQWFLGRGHRSIEELEDRKLKEDIERFMERRMGTPVILNVQAAEIKLGEEHIKKIREYVYNSLKRRWQRKVRILRRQMEAMAKRIEEEKQMARKQGFKQATELLKLLNKKKFEIEGDFLVYTGSIRAKKMQLHGEVYRLKKSNPFVIRKLYIKFSDRLTQVYAGEGTQHPNVKDFPSFENKYKVCLGTLFGAPMTVENIEKLIDTLRTVNMDSAFWGSDDAEEWIARYAEKREEKVWEVG